MWKYYALLSALFASLTAIFAKIGIKDVNSDLATAIRTSIIVLLTWQQKLRSDNVKRDPAVAEDGDKAGRVGWIPALERLGREWSSVANTSSNISHLVVIDATYQTRR